MGYILSLEENHPRGFELIAAKLKHQRKQKQNISNRGAPHSFSLLQVQDLSAIKDAKNFLTSGPFMCCYDWLTTIIQLS